MVKGITRPPFSLVSARKGGVRRCACGHPVIPGDWSCYSCAAS